MLPIELTNKDIRNSEAYKEYYAIVTGAAPRKTKASVKKTKSSSDTTVTPPTAAAGTRLSTSAKDKQPTKASKANSLTVLSEVAMTEAKQLKLATKSSGSGAYEGTEDDDVDEGSDDQDEGDDDDDQNEEETKDGESFDPIAKALENLDDEGNDDENLGLNVGREEGQDEEDDEDELYRDVNINLEGRVVQMADFAGAVSSILEIVQRYMIQRMNEAVKVKVQVSKILPKIKKTMNEQLEAEVLTRSSNSSKTSYAVTADLSEIELKKILIEKMEGNKSIHRSDEQRNLYKALVKAYESDKIILDTYGDIVTLKRRRDDDADKDEEPSAGSDRGSKRRREGKEPESTSAPKEKVIRTIGKSTQGSKSQQKTASEPALAEEPIQTTHDLEEPSHQEFVTGAADDQPIAKSSQHLEWFQQQKKRPTPDLDWNKTLPATHESIQPWISELAKQADSRSSFNELMDTPMDFSAFLMNRLKVDTLTSELLAGPTYELMKGSCKSLAELEFFLEEVYKANTD
nr:hypothetical protein [Tanacetum cinerariifolium]